MKRKERNVFEYAILGDSDFECCASCGYPLLPGDHAAVNFGTGVVTCGALHCMDEQYRRQIAAGIRTDYWRPPEPPEPTP